MLKHFSIFDSHLHIIDSCFPLVPNQGYMPESFAVADYQSQVAAYDVCGGAVVSGSFQAFDQSYLVHALKEMGPGFVGVTQLPFAVSDEELQELNQAGVRAVRFNLKRGGSEDVQHLDAMARRVYELLGWHIELYVDSIDLHDLYPVLSKLPAYSIDHLGLSRSGFKMLLKLVEQGARVKATGFGRVDFDVLVALKELNSVNPAALMFGTDLPSTRAPRPYQDTDLQLITDNFDPAEASRILCENAREFYRLPHC